MLWVHNDLEVATMHTISGPRDGMTVHQLLNGLVNAAQELGEVSNREENDGVIEQYEARVASWRAAVEARMVDVAMEALRTDIRTGQQVTCGRPVDEARRIAMREPDPRCRRALAGSEHGGHVWYGNHHAGDGPDYHRCPGLST